MDRSSQRSHNEREKFGEEAGSAVIEDLSDFGHIALDQDDDDDDDEQGGGVDGAARALVAGGGGEGGPLDLVTAIRSLEKTIAIHCKLMNRKLRREKTTTKSESKITRPLPKLTVRGDKVGPSCFIFSLPIISTQFSFLKFHIHACPLYPYVITYPILPHHIQL